MLNVQKYKSPSFLTDVCFTSKSNLYKASIANSIAVIVVPIAAIAAKKSVIGGSFVRLRSLVAFILSRCEPPFSRGRYA